MPYIGGPQAYTGVVDLLNPEETRPLGPCPVLNVIAGIPDRARQYRSVWGERQWQERAAAVLAYLTEAGFKPSIYPGEELGSMLRDCMASMSRACSRGRRLTHAPCRCAQRPFWSVRS